MQTSEQQRVIDGLLEHLDNGTNVDAGGQMRLPVDTYSCQDRATKEWHSFFQNYAHVLGLSGDLPGPNTFFTTQDLGKPVLCTRDRNGNFRAFINACRHRGTMVEQEERGTRNVFTCPFHAWSYSPEGNLVAVPKEEHFGAIDKSSHGLVPLPAVEAHGLLFVHPDPNAEIDLDAQLGKTLRAEFESWQWQKHALQGEDVYQHPMNWKLAIDTFGETYHFTSLHKDTLAQDFYGNVQMYDTYERNHRMNLCLKSIDSLRNLPKEQWHILTAALPVYYIFPNVQLIETSAGATLVKVYPKGEDPNDSFSKVHFYLRPELQQIDDPHMKAEIDDRLRGFGAVIRDEDYAAAATSHLGMKAGAMDTVVFGRNEPALHHYHATYREALGLPALGTD